MRGDIGFGLVVVVVGDKILDRIIGKKGFKLLVELGGQGFVVGNHQRGPLHLLNHIGHRKGLARTGNPQQHLRFSPLQIALQPAFRWPAG